MIFPPSDVIGTSYHLTLTCPTDVKFGDKELSLDVVVEDSGCQFIHGPLENWPNRRSDSRGTHVEMMVPGPLLPDLHQLSLTWKGKVKA